VSWADERVDLGFCANITGRRVTHHASSLHIRLECADVPKRKIGAINTTPHPCYTLHGTIHTVTRRNTHMIVLSA
jgi:hypothetical protein